MEKRIRKIGALVIVGMLWFVTCVPVTTIAQWSVTIGTDEGYRIIIDNDNDAVGDAFAVWHDGDENPEDELFRVQENGCVGIGTQEPINNLDVAGNAAVGEGYAGEFFAPPNGMIIEGPVGIGTPFPMNQLDVAGNMAVGQGFAGVFAPQNGMIVEGDVGIGIMFPESILHVSAGFEGEAELILESDIGNFFEGDNPSITFTQDGGNVEAFIALEGIGGENAEGTLPDAFVIGHAGENAEVQNPIVQFATNGEVRMTIGENGEVGIGLPLAMLPMNQLDVAGNVAIGQGFAGQIAPPNGMIVEGWVGIGTPNPSSTLDVNGDIEIGGGNAFYFGDPNTDGSWRITRDGDNLVFQRRENGNWVTKLNLAP